MERKEFIKTIGMACFAGTALTTLLQGCASTTYFAQHTLSNNTIAISKAEFVAVLKGKTTQRNYVLIKSEKFNFPICVYKISTNEYSALLMECTHNSCELNPQGNFLICPCHGSEFTNKGVVQNPPAEANLKTFQLTTDNENIYVQL